MSDGSGKVGRRDVLACAFLSALWWAPLSIIGLHGDFPLNDDFAHAQATRTLLETGRFELSNWTLVPLYTNVALGVAFSSLLGFSFETLRLSSLCMGWFGVLGAYFLSQQAGAGRAPSALGALVFGFNPIYLNLSYTFMTDVPFAALSVWSLLLLARGLRLGSGLALLGGMGFALAAALSRQQGAAIPVALLAALCVARLEGWRRRIALGVAVLAGAGLFWGASQLFGSGGSRTLQSLAQLRKSLFAAGGVGLVGTNALTSVSYLGLFLAPVLALVGWGMRRASARALVLFGALGTFVAALAGRRMPFGFNILYDLGLGPSTLHGALRLPGAPSWFWWLVTFGALAGGAFCIALLAVGVTTRRSELRRRPEALLLLIFPVLYLAPFLGLANFFDRYLLPVLPCLAALLLTLPGRPAPATRRGCVAALLLLAPLATYAVLGTRDYLEWNRARWALLAPLIERGVPPQGVDGGFEFDGWSGLDPEARWSQRLAGREHAEFLLSYVKLDARAYRALDARAYTRLLPPRIEILTLYRKNPRASKPGASRSEADLTRERMRRHAP